MTKSINQETNKNNPLGIDEGPDMVPYRPETMYFQDPRPSEVSLSGGAGYAQVAIPFERGVQNKKNFVK